jgi:hypothetical protein
MLQRNNHACIYFIKFYTFCISLRSKDYNLEDYKPQTIGLFFSYLGIQSVYFVLISKNFLTTI